MNTSSSASSPIYDTPSRAFGGRYPMLLDDDPWENLHRANRAELKPALKAEFFTTVDSSAISVGSADSYDALHMINLALEEMPERGDFLMMRFELLCSLQRKEEFAEILQKVWRNPMLARKLDGQALRRMWRKLAPWEAPPADVELPAEESSITIADQQARQLQFNELMQRLAAEPLARLREIYAAARKEPRFGAHFVRSTNGLLHRPTPLQFAVQLSSAIGSRARVFLKREDTREVAPHLENAAIQVYVARTLGRKEVIAGNDLDEHSLALADMAESMGLHCTILMTEGEIEAKGELAARLRATGAQVRSCDGLPLETQDSREGALRLWLERSDSAHLALLPESAPAPYPAMVADLRALLGHETEMQLRSQTGTERPRAFIAARHSRADSIGWMLPLLPRGGMRLIYAEPEYAGRVPAAADKMAIYNGANKLHARLRGLRPGSYLPVSDAKARVAQDRVYALEGIRLSLEDARAAALAWTVAADSTQNWDIVVLAA